MTEGKKYKSDKNKWIKIGDTSRIKIKKAAYNEICDTKKNYSPMIWALMDEVFTKEEMASSNYKGGKSKNSAIAERKEALNKEKLTAIKDNDANIESQKRFYFLNLSLFNIELLFFAFFFQRKFKNIILFQIQSYLECLLITNANL